MNGNRISVKTLDLNLEFADIVSQLNFIAENYLLADITKRK